MLARAPAYSFLRKFLCFRFSRSLKAIKRATRKFRTIYCCSNIIKMTFVIKLSLLKRKRSAVIIWLCLRLSSICFSEISQNFHNLWNFSMKRRTKAVSSLFAILCFLLLSQIWPFEFVLSTGTRKGTNMFNGPANLWKIHRMKGDKSCSKDLYFLCRLTVRKGIELRQDLYLSMR